MNEITSLPNLTGEEWTYGSDSDVSIRQRGYDIYIAMTWKPRHREGDRPLAPHYEITGTIRRSEGKWIFEADWKSNYCGPGHIAADIISNNELVFKSVTNGGNENLQGLVIKR